MSKARTINRAAAKYQEQLNEYVKQFAEAAARGDSNDELKVVYENLDHAWGRVCSFVNNGNRTFKLKPEAFENRIKQIIKIVEEEKNKELITLEMTAAAENAPEDFLKSLIVPVIVAIILTVIILMI